MKTGNKPYTELPPRARRIHNVFLRCQCNPGTTSACAENTAKTLITRPEGGNYLRVRGEYSQPLLIASPIMELPPRARRIRIILENHTRKGGTTSACAENTLPLVLMGRQKRNYLRVRGEYWAAWRTLSTNSELPPRARRIPGAKGIYASPPGTTSACAENTFCPIASPPKSWNYLRVRGEYPIHSSRAEIEQGTTSACAENTGSSAKKLVRAWNYLRVRGEYPK